MYGIIYLQPYMDAMEYAVWKEMVCISSYTIHGSWYLHKHASDVWIPKSHNFAVRKKCGISVHPFRLKISSEQLLISHTSGCFLMFFFFGGLHATVFLGMRSCEGKNMLNYMIYTWKSRLFQVRKWWVNEWFFTQLIKKEQYWSYQSTGG